VYLHGLRAWIPLETADQGYVWLQADVCDCGLGPRPRLNSGPVYDDSAAEAAVVALYKGTYDSDIVTLWSHHVQRHSSVFSQHIYICMFRVSAIGDAVHAVPQNKTIT